MQQHTPYDDGVPPRIAAVSAKPLASKRAIRHAGARARELDKMIARDDRIAARVEREREMAGKAARASSQLQQMTAGKRYGVICADPPWRFEPYSRETGMSRAADNHYSTLSTDAIATIRVPAAEDCILFLWATPAMKQDALRVMAAWGFAYKTTYYWHKPGRGHGYRSCKDQVEELLVGTRGRVPAPVMGTQPPQKQTYPRGRHSAKPPEFRAMIEQLFPTTPKIELFARGAPAPGWDAWGEDCAIAPEPEASALTSCSPSSLSDLMVQSV
jgi:N6-adenosine-specific RNA methylase IME4